MTVIRTLTACFAAFLLTAAAPAQKGTVALTFDDLPVFGSFKSAADGAQVTDRLLDGLQRHHWKATGFVNEVQLEAPDKPQRVALLKRWLDAGMDLGNHTYSHLSLNTTTVDAYIADIARDEAETAHCSRRGDAGSDGSAIPTSRPAARGSAATRSRAGLPSMATASPR